MIAYCFHRWVRGWRAGRVVVDTCNEGCNDWLQLPSLGEADSVRPAEDHNDLLGGFHGKYQMRQTEDSKSRLQLLRNAVSFRMKIQQQSIDQLHQLVSEYDVSPQTIHGEVPKSKDRDEKLRQLLDIEDQLRSLELTKGQTTQLLCAYNAWLEGMLRDRECEDMQTITYRLEMMHVRNDSVWLLCAGLDWLLPAVQNILQLQYTRGGRTNPCPADKEGCVQLLHKFTSRIEDWKESLDKQKRLHIKLSGMFWCWPEYPWVRLNFAVHQNLIHGQRSD